MPAARSCASWPRRPARTSGRVGTTTARPPWSPVPLGALAGRPFEPAKRSSIHARHRELGAHVMWAGDWRRAYDYGDPQGEALAVHESAGLIDVSTLGKLLVRGPEAGAFLDRLYPNRFVEPRARARPLRRADLRRRADHRRRHDLPPATTRASTSPPPRAAPAPSSSGSPGGWPTGAWTSRSPTSPRPWPRSTSPGRAPARSWAALTDLDCSNEAFAYLDAARARSPASRACCCASASSASSATRSTSRPPHGEHLWDAILEAGAEHGIRPFGLEPQRILRLQKHAHHRRPGHRLGVDAVRRGDAVDRQARQGRGLHRQLGARARRRAPSETALVGFTLPDGDVPTEGAAVLDERGEPVGQVTSARYSRQLGRVIGMAWVPAALASDGARDHDLRREPAPARRGHDRGRSTTPTARCCARDRLRVPPGAVGRRRRPQPDGAPGAGRRRADRGARRLERRRRLPPRAARRTPRSAWADVSHLRKLEVTAPARAGRRHRRRGPTARGGARSRASARW